MPLPRDGEDWRLMLVTNQRDEARRVACEQYTRANRLERERDKWRSEAQEYYKEYDEVHDECISELDEARHYAEMANEQAKVLGRVESIPCPLAGELRAGVD